MSDLDVKSAVQVEDHDNSDSASDDGVLVYTPPENELDDDIQALLDKAAILDLHDKDRTQAIEDQRLADEVSEKLNEELAGQSVLKTSKRGGQSKKAQKDVEHQVEQQSEPQVEQQIEQKIEQQDTDTISPASAQDGEGNTPAATPKNKKKGGRSGKKHKKKSKLAAQQQVEDVAASASGAKEVIKATTSTSGSPESKTKTQSQKSRKGKEIERSPKKTAPSVPTPASTNKSKEAPAVNIPEPKQSKKTRKKTVVGDWEDYFGNETNLANWQRLCTDVGIEELPTSITQCRKALGKVWVNIYDFLDAKAAGKPIKKYKSERQLAAYTLNSGKIYPKKHAKEGGPAKVLLAHILRH
ncbi:transcription factor Zn C2H2 protein [Rutstroemia sp. NJR-2017a BBW]|nr:transcription factor Zn C2H2 protein [Rutstroemia sp. NJR-2017a BBW]